MANGGFDVWEGANMENWGFKGSVQGYVFGDVRLSWFGTKRGSADVGLSLDMVWLVWDGLEEGQLWGLGLMNVAARSMDLGFGADSMMKMELGKREITIPQ